jgi:hypothetical protein
VEFPAPTQELRFSHKVNLSAGVRLAGAFVFGDPSSKGINDIFLHGPPTSGQRQIGAFPEQGAIEVDRVRGHSIAFFIRIADWTS